MPLALLAAGLPEAAQATISATPGVLNYTEGEVSIDGRVLSRHAAFSTDLGRGQVLTTDAGKAEILLTPGAFLRVGDHSSVRMVSPSLTDTRLALQQGEALVEVTQLYKGNHIKIPVRRYHGPGRVALPPPGRTVQSAPSVRSGLGRMRSGGGMTRGGGMGGRRR